MCTVFKVSRSGYYAWLNRGTSKREEENKMLLKKIKKIHEESSQTYGSPRITEELKNMSIFVSRCRVARIMKKAGIQSKIKKKYVVTTDSKHSYPVAPNLLERNFQVEKPGKVWVSDITYIRADKKWIYLTVVIDLFDRKIIGWSVSTSLDAKSTTIPALYMALLIRMKDPKLIFHSDQGIQYACEEFTKRLKKENIIQSMSRKGDCWDNAVAESFFKSIKIENIYTIQKKPAEQMKRNIFWYIEAWYNRKRRHSSLNYLTPLEMENLYYNNLIAA